MQAFSHSTGEIIDDAEIISVTPVSQAHSTTRRNENEDFVQLYRRFIQQISDLGIENPTALRVLLFLIKHMDGKNAIGVPQKLIAEMVNLSRQTVSGAVTYLRDNGWLEIYKLGKANIYIVNPDVVWTSYADQKSYCKFEGKIMLDSQDNWQLTRKDKTNVKYLDPLTIAHMAQKEFPDEEE